MKMARQQTANQGEAVAMDDDFSDRMTRQQAEQARRGFEFPGWVCLGIIDMTASAGGWGLIIARHGESADFYVYVSWRLWIQEWQLGCHYRARDGAYMDERGFSALSSVTEP
jgi:hypothetical protein